MVSANALTVAYVGALLVATPTTMLVEGKKPAKLTRLTQEQMGKMEREMRNLQGQHKMVEQIYAEDVLNPVLAKRFLAKLLDNRPVAPLTAAATVRRVSRVRGDRADYVGGSMTTTMQSNRQT